MSDQKSGPGDKGGFGPKKPRATFGDVMLGIRAGQGGARDERGGGKPDRGRRSDRPDRGPRPERDRREPRPEQKAEGAEPAAQPASGETAEASSEAKPQDRQQRDNRRDRGGGRGDRGDRGGHGKKPGGGERKPQGPLVVVKRASGVIETRPLEPTGEAAGPAAAPSADAASTEQPTAEATEAAAPAPAPARPAPTRPETPKSALYEEVPENQSFAEMFEAAAKQEGGSGRRQVRVGEKVSGKIFQLGADTAFVSLGGKSEAMIELRELKDDEGILRYGVGDVVEAHVVEAGAKGIILSRTLAKGAASMAMLSEARVSGIPVEGLVLQVNKGGLEVAVGDVRAFCPISQVDIRFVEKPDQFIGERLKFRVMEVRDRNVVLSRRALLEEEQKALAAETRKRLNPGAVVKGKVTSVRDFGAFVDLGGVEGMIPVSEMSHTRVAHPNEVVKVGDEVEVEILKLDPPNPSSPDKAKQKERITLSMRARQEDPWKTALAEIQEGARLKGKVVRLQPFGAFVELRPGVDGLIHISALSNRRIAHPRDVVQVGQEVDVVVEKVDEKEKRIGLRRVTEEEAAQPAEAAAPAGATEKPKREEAPRPKVGQLVTGKIDRIEQYGVFVAFPGGKGLVPASETGTERGTDMKRAFQLGQEVKVSVLEIDASGKIRLSLTAAAKAEERADMEAWVKTQQPKGGGGKGFGTFADLLKGKKI